MKTYMITTALAFALATPAAAFFGGDTTNNYGGDGGNASAAAAASAAASSSTYSKNVNKNYNTNVNKQGQAQGQLQGQAQGQSTSVNNEIEGSVAFGIGAAMCTNSVGFGIPGAGGAGVSWTRTDCLIWKEADMLRQMGREKAALTHLSQIKRLRDTFEALGWTRTGTVGTVSSKTAPRAPTASAPAARTVKAAFGKCELRDDGKIGLTVRRGADRAVAISQCRSHLGY